MIRARMEKTGETYQQALRRLRARIHSTPQPVFAGVQLVDMSQVAAARRARPMDVLEVGRVVLVRLRTAHRRGPR